MREQEHDEPIAAMGEVLPTRLMHTFDELGRRSTCSLSYSEIQLPHSDSHFPVRTQANMNCPATTPDFSMTASVTHVAT